MGVGVVETGHGECAVEVDDVGLRTSKFKDVGVGACGKDFSLSDGECGDFGRGGGGVVLAEVGAGEDVAVKEDGVGGGLRVGHGCGEEEGAEGEGFHGWECSRVTPPPARVLRKVFQTWGLGLDFRCKFFILRGRTCKVLIRDEKDRNCGASPDFRA